MLSQAESYEEFEHTTFNNQITSTSELVDKTNQFMEQIDTKLDKMTQDLSDVNIQLSSVTPNNKEQIKKLNKLNANVANIDKVLKAADEEMERNDTTKVALFEGH